MMKRFVGWGVAVACAGAVQAASRSSEAASGRERIDGFIHRAKGAQGNASGSRVARIAAVTLAPW